MHWELVQDTLASLISVLAAIGAGWILCGMYALVSLHFGIARWFSEGILQRGVDQRTS